VRTRREQREDKHHEIECGRGAALAPADTTIVRRKRVRHQDPEANASGARGIKVEPKWAPLSAAAFTVRGRLWVWILHPRTACKRMRVWRPAKRTASRFTLPPLDDGSPSFHRLHLHLHRLLFQAFALDEHPHLSVRGLHGPIKGQESNRWKRANKRDCSPLFDAPTSSANPWLPSVLGGISPAQICPSKSGPSKHRANQNRVTPKFCGHHFVMAKHFAILNPEVYFHLSIAAIKQRGTVCIYVAVGLDYAERCRAAFRGPEDVVFDICKIPKKLPLSRLLDTAWRLGGGGAVFWCWRLIDGEVWIQV